MRWLSWNGESAVAKICLIAAVVLLFDQCSKYFASQAGVVILNSGMSFQLGANLPQWVWVVIIGALVIGLLKGFWSTWQRFPLWSGVFFGGVISNGLDRVIGGGVRDFLPLPILNLRNNVADYAIGISVMVLLWLEWSSSRQKHE